MTYHTTLNSSKFADNSFITTVMRSSSAASVTIYLDYNATTPLDESVLKSMMTAGSLWGNPSSSYDYGSEARGAVEDARIEVARMLNASSSSEIIFTSGGTECNNWIIQSSLKEFEDVRSRGSRATETAPNSCATQLPHFISSNIEHDSIKLPLENLCQSGKIECSFVAVSKKTGTLDVETVLGAIKRNTILVTVMLANNETGLIQPVQEICVAVSEINKERAINGLSRILLHTDAAQVIGKLPVDVQELAVDYLTVVGHKFYGPRIGALYCREGRPLHPLFFGGGQEGGLRPGTQNVMAIAGLGKACELVSENLDAYRSKFLELQKHLEDMLETEFGHTVTVNGKEVTTGRLPNTTSVSFRDGRLKGAAILKRCSSIRASVGAACHSSSGDTRSSVLINSGVEPELATCTLRLSVGRETTVNQLNKAMVEILCAVNFLIGKESG